MANDLEVEFHEIEIAIFHEIETYNNISQFWSGGHYDHEIATQKSIITISNFRSHDHSCD